jgi:phosphoribosylamine-glycine ligase
LTNRISSAISGADDHGRAFDDDPGCRFGGFGFACMALVADFPFRGGSPASMVIRTR